MKKNFLTLMFLGTVFFMQSCGSSSFTLKGSDKAEASSSNLATGGSPTAIKMNMFALWLCINAACTDCILVQDNGATPVEHDLANNPTLFSGSPADGTYNCMVMKAYDTMNFVADAEAETIHGTTCTEGTEYTFDTYREASGDSDLWTTYPDHSTITATGTVANPGSDIVYYFVSTTPSAVIANTHQTLTLSNPIVVPGDEIFYADFTDQISTNDGHCWLETPTMGIQ